MIPAESATTSATCTDPGHQAWLTSYIPDDEESIKGCEMDWPTANQALGAVAGLLHLVARDHAAAGV